MNKCPKGLMRRVNKDRQEMSSRETIIQQGYNHYNALSKDQLPWSLRQRARG